MVCLSSIQSLMNTTLAFYAVFQCIFWYAASSTGKTDAPEQKPVFRATSRNVTVGPGDRAVLRCKVDYLGTKTVTWKKYDDVHPLTIGLFTFAPDTRINADYNQRTNEWSLIIQDVRPIDEGVYQCQISTKNEHDTYDIQLNVKNIQVSGSAYVEKGGDIELICNATGKPEPPHDIEWYKGGVKINSDAQSGVIITKKIETKVLVSILVIKDSKTTDSGDYTCRSSDLDTGTLTVHILTAPSPVEKRGTTAERKMKNSGNSNLHPNRQQQQRSTQLILASLFVAFHSLSTSFAR